MKSPEIKHVYDQLDLNTPEEAELDSLSHGSLTPKDRRKGNNFFTIEGLGRFNHSILPQFCYKRTKKHKKK
jgi:hypothetical protein